jgi:uncharacterized caspase-like protein
MANGERFYLLPHDLGYAGARDKIDAAGMKLLTQHGISDEGLAAAFENLDAARIVLVIDACNSGQALEAEDNRRGPMNSKGLAQLAYEKGMYILTAAQGYQKALESSNLKDASGQGHGLLTYALIEEGLEQGKAKSADGNIYLRPWLDYAVAEVPRLRSAQRPRVFYRKEPESKPAMVGIGTKEVARR